MRFSLILENTAGERVDLSTTADQYMVSKIDGLYPPPGTLATSAYACMDGSVLEHAFLEKRNIVISFVMRGIWLERRRQALYHVVRPAQEIRVYYRTAGIDVYADGYVETCNVPHFEKLVSGQISILCPDIFLYSRQQTFAYFRKIKGLFHFPFPENDASFPLGTYQEKDIVAIQNNGEAVGFTIQIETDPDAPEIAANSVTITNMATGSYLQLNTEIQKGDVIMVTTKTGNKTVTLIRNGVPYNRINSISEGSSWLTLQPGANRFQITGGEHLSITMIHTDAWLGV